MELYIEKEFLDNFNADFKNRSVQVVVKEMITKYGDKKVFIDFDENDFRRLENENEYFALISNTFPPCPVENIEDHLLNKSNYKQTLVFTNKTQPWFQEAGEKGAICFSFENYEEKISEIINKLHFRIDLSDRFTGWSFLEGFNVINFNKITISDGYILTDKDNQKIDKNLIPILKTILADKKGEIEIDILTKNLNSISDSAEHKKEKAKKRLKKINNVFANFNTKFSIILNEFSSDITYHDRNIITNFSLLDCGEGFNLLPYKASNSQIISDTIFDKYTYNRLKRIKNSQEEYINKLIKLDTSKFKMYPEVKRAIN